MSPDTVQAIGLTLKLAASTTLVLLALATPLAWWLARSRSKWAGLLGVLTTLPMVLPPTVLGFYLLIAMGPHGPWGWAMRHWGWPPLAFSFTGLLIGSVIYSCPFAVQPLRQAFMAMGQRPLDVAATLGVHPFTAFWHVAVPMARSGFLTAAILSFAHTIGEFGVVLMIGGNIPGQTRVLSTELYGHVEALEYDQAHALALLLLGFAVIVLGLLAWLDHQAAKRRAKATA